MDLLFSSHFPQSLKKLQGRCLFWEVTGMRQTDWQKKRSKKTQKQGLHQAQLRTGNQHFSGCLEVLNPSCGMLVCHASLVHTRNPASSWWAPGTYLHVHFCQGYDIPASRKGETFGVYLWAPGLPWHLDASCMSDPGQVPGKTHTHFCTADSASCSQVSEGYFRGKLEMKHLAGSIFAVIVIIYMLR